MSDLMSAVMHKLAGQHRWYKASYNWNVYYDAINSVYKVYRFVLSVNNNMYFDKEVHEFQTEEYAKWFADFCNRLDAAILPVARTRVIPWQLIGESETSWSLTDSRTGAKIVFSVDKAGNLSKINLLEIIRIWIKLSALGRGLKALWYGWGKA